MYSEVVNGLGFSQSAMEMIVFFGIIIAVIGVVLVLYWKYIIMGTLAVACVAVMANHKPVVKESVEKKEEVINQVKPEVEPTKPSETSEKPHVDLSEPPHVDLSEPPHVDLSETKDVYNEFMYRCINMADYTKTQCEELWSDRVKEERAILEDTKHKGKNHGDYRKV